jgi:hypothetical protein
MPNTVDDYNIFVDDERGQRVLANMLLEGGFFRVTKTLEEQAVQNFLKVVLSKTGRYPIESHPDEDSAFVRTVNYVAGFKKGGPLNFVRNLLRMKKEY